MTTPSEPTPPQQPAGRMVDLLNSHLLAQALYVATQLGLADLLVAGGKSVDELAASTGTHGPSLQRLLRMLTSEGVFRETNGGHFALTPLGETLCTDSANSVRDRALYLAAPEVWAACGELLHSIRTGEPAFDHLHAGSFYETAVRQPAIGAPFNRWMTRGSELDNAAVVACYDFSRFHLVVDVGGGHGATLAAILRASPGLRGILFDLSSVVERAEPLRTGDLDGRYEIAAGDMTQAVPPGGDAYVIKNCFSG